MQLDESEKIILRLLRELDQMSTVDGYAERATALMVDKLPGEQQRAFLMWFLTSPEAIKMELNSIDPATAKKLRQNLPDEKMRIKVLQKAVLAKLRSRFNLTSLVEIAREVASLRMNT